MGAILMMKWFALLLAVLTGGAAWAQQVPHPPQWGSVPTNAALAASPISQFPNGVWRDDHSAGRGAGNLFFVGTSGTCAAGGLANDGGACVNSAGGNSWRARPADGALHTLQFDGIDAGGSTDTSAALARFCAALNSGPYRRGIVDPGTYKLAASINCTQTRDLSIAWAPGARFYADAALSTNALYITGTPGPTANSYNLDLYQPYINMSEATCPGGVCAFQATTAIYTDLQLRTTLHQPRLIGGVSYTNASATNGWTPTRTVSAEIFGGAISGFAGGGIYASGDLVANSPPPLYNLTVLGTRFSHNGAGVECKFLINTCNVSGGIFYYNQLDIGCFWAGAPDIEPPCRNLIATGNSHKFTRNYFWSVPGGTSAVITGNIARDLGYNDQPVSPNTCGAAPNGNAAGLFDDGAQGIVFTGNKVQYVDCAPIAGVPAVSVRSTTFNGGASVYGGGGIAASGNQFTLMSIGLYEHTVGGNTILPSAFRAQQMDQVPSPVTGLAGNSKAGTVMSWTEATTGLTSNTMGGFPSGVIEGSRTVAALAAAYPCTATLRGVTSTVSDAAAPAWHTALTGGGAVVSPVYCDGAGWKAY